MNKIFQPEPAASAEPLIKHPRLQSLLQEIRNRRQTFSVAQHIPKDIIAKFQDIGVYRALVARRYGGEERSPADFCHLIETIARVDGSSAWVASFGAAASYLAGLPEETLKTIYANGPDVVFAGGLFPLQPAQRTAGGFVINGRWKFASGCMGASLIGAGIVVPDDATGGLPRVAVMPADKIRIVPDWDVMGLQGTGSHDVVIENVTVPEEWTLIRGGKASFDSPITRYPNMALAAQVLAVVGLGVARAALDEVIVMAGGDKSITGAPRMADRAHVQLAVAKGEAALRSARSFFYEATEQAWAEARSGQPVTVEATTALRLAATHAARTAADVTESAFRLAGTTAIYQQHDLARSLADSSVVAQHAFLGEGTLQSAGRIFLGLPPTPGFP